MIRSILSLLLNIFEPTNLVMNWIVFKIFLFVFGLSISCYSQDFSSLWQGHYSYNSIVDVVSGENKIYAAAQNAIFQYDVLTNGLNTITTVEGLSGEQITTIYYSDLYQYLLIGYETGLIEVYSETDESVLAVVDILDKFFFNVIPTILGLPPVGWPKIFKRCLSHRKLT